MVKISGPVGKGAVSSFADAVTVQVLLNSHIGFNPNLFKLVKPLVADGKVDGKNPADPTVKAIKAFQREILGFTNPDGRVDPGGKTITALTGPIASPVKPSSTPAATPDWECYTRSNWKHNPSLPGKVKQWLEKRPSHEREVGIFHTTRIDAGRRIMFLAYKSLNARSNCKNIHGVHTDEVLHGWFERETSLGAVKSNHGLKTDWISILGNDAGGKGIAAMNVGMNMLMSYYVLKKGMCIHLATTQAKTMLHREGKAIMEIVSAVVSGAAGAKSGGTAAPVPRNHVTLKLSELDWAGFVDQLHEIATDEYKKSRSVDHRTLSVGIDEKIRNEDNTVIGAVKYFD